MRAVTRMLSTSVLAVAAAAGLALPATAALAAPAATPRAANTGFIYGTDSDPVTSLARLPEVVTVAVGRAREISLETAPISEALAADT